MYKWTVIGNCRAVKLQKILILAKCLLLKTSVIKLTSYYSSIFDKDYKHVGWNWSFQHHQSNYITQGRDPNDHLFAICDFRTKDVTSWSEYGADPHIVLKLCKAWIFDPLFGCSLCTSCQNVTGALHKNTRTTF